MVTVSRRARRRAVLSVVALLAACVLASGICEGRGVPAHRLLKGFQRSGRYILYVQGQHVKQARIYHSRLASSYLLLDTPFGAPVLVNSRTQTVQTVDEQKMIEREDGNIYFIEDAKPADAGTARRDGVEITFRLDEKPARLKRNPPLLGRKTYEELIQHSPQYFLEGRMKTLDARALQALKDYKGEAHVLVIFGSWCSTCKRHLPGISKLNNELAGAGASVRFEYHGVLKGSRDPVLTQNGVRRLPAVIVTAGGRQVGKGIGNEASAPARLIAGYLGLR